MRSGGNKAKKKSELTCNASDEHNPGSIHSCSSKQREETEHKCHQLQTLTGGKTKDNTMLASGQLNQIAGSLMLHRSRLERN